MLLRSDPSYVKLYNDLVDFAKFVHISGLPVQREDVYGSKVIDGFKFVFYLSKCLFRTILVAILLLRLYQESSLWDQ
jgi:hypothetical protein